MTKSSTRVRASKTTLAMALKALVDAGIPIDKLVIEGGKIEIHCIGGKIADEDDGLKPW